MKEFRNYIQEKLSRRFILWFSITLIFPLIGLMIFTINSFTDREALLTQQVRESQLNRVLKTENFYITQFRRGYRQAIRGLFAKISEQTHLLSQSLDPENELSSMKYSANYTDFYYSKILPYLGFEIDPKALNRANLQAESFAIAQLMQLFYFDPEWHDFYDGLALSNSDCEEYEVANHKTDRKRVEFCDLHEQFKRIHRERKKWIPNRKFPDYKDIAAKDVLRYRSQLDPQDISIVFRNFIAFQRFKQSTKLSGSELQDLRVLVSQIVQNRFKILDNIIKLRKEYYSIKQDLKNLIDSIIVVLEVPKKSNVALESMDDLKKCIETVLAGLNSKKYFRGSDYSPLKSNFESLRQRFENLSAALNSCRAAILKYFHVGGMIMPEQSNWEAILEKTGFSDIESFIANFDLTKLSDDQQETSALVPFYYLIKLMKQGLKGKEWIHFAHACEIYTFPIRRIFELKNELDYAYINPQIYNQDPSFYLEINSKQIFEVFKPLPALKHFLEMTQEEWQKPTYLQDIRDTVNTLMIDRFKLLEDFKNLMDQYFRIKQDIRTWNDSLMDKKLEMPLESLDNIKGFIDAIPTEKKELEAKFENLSANLDSCKQAILKYFPINGSLWKGSLNWQAILASTPDSLPTSAFSFISSQALSLNNTQTLIANFISRFDPSKHSHSQKEPSAWLPLYYLLKFEKEGLKGKHWIDLESSIDLYAIPSRQVFVLRDDLGQAIIKPAIPDYIDYSDSEIDASQIFEVFKPLPALMHFREMPHDEMQQSSYFKNLGLHIRKFSGDRFKLLRIISEIFTGYYEIREQVNNLDQLILAQLELSNQDQLHSIDDLRNFISVAKTKLNSASNSEDPRYEDLKVKFEKLGGKLEYLTISLNSCRSKILEYFPINNSLLESSSSWQVILSQAEQLQSTQTLTFSNTLSQTFTATETQLLIENFISTFDPSKFSHSANESSALLPLYYLLKFEKQGLTGKQWVDFTHAADIYSFPVSKKFRFNRNAKIEIRPEIRRNTKSYGGRVAGYFGLERVINVRQAIQDDWTAPLKLIPDYIIPYNLTAELSLANNKRDLAALLWDSNLADTRGVFNSIKVGTGDLAMIWEVLPVSFDLSDFVMGHCSTPKAYLLSLLGDHGIRLQFFRLWNSSVSIKNKRDLPAELSKSLNHAYRQLVPEKMLDSKPGFNYMQAGPEIKKLTESLYSYKFSLDKEHDGRVDFWSFAASYLGINRSYLSHRNEAWLDATELQVLALRESVNDQQIPEKLYVDQVMQGYVGKDSKIYEDFKKWLLNPDAGPFPLDFEDNNGRRRIGSILSGGELRDFVFLLHMDAEIAYQENDYLLVLLILICLLALIFGIGLGRLLAHLVVIPVNKLSVNVADFSAGDLKDPIKVERGDEIGRMAFYFNEMVANIETKINEMESINRLNDALLRGSTLKDLMQDAVTELCVETGAEIGYLGFFEHASREKLMGSGDFGISDLRREDLELRFKVLTNRLGDQEFHFLPSRIAKNYYCENLFILKISPQSVNLQGMENVLDELVNLDEYKQNVQIEGFLVLGNFPEGTLDSDKLDFLHSFASQTGTVIAKAHLDKVKKDNQEGQNIQEGMMPSEAPDSRGRLDISFAFIAAKYLGGDFFDFVNYESSDHVGMLISDVSGKGIGPSLFGTTCQAYLQLLALDPNQTGETLENINERLCENKTNSLFATAFYLAIDLATLKMTYSSAGHNKMYLFRQATGKIEYLSAKGLVLGMFSPGIYQTSNLNLEVGDWIILYTDGITELENPSLELYGMERFEELILANTDRSANELRDLILADLDVYRDSVPPSDDITFILVKVLQEPETIKTDLHQNDIRYVASRNSKTFHIASSAAGNRIEINNRVYFDSWKEAVESGRKPSKRLANKLSNS